MANVLQIEEIGLIFDYEKSVGFITFFGGGVGNSDF